MVVDLELFGLHLLLQQYWNGAAYKGKAIMADMVTFLVVSASRIATQVSLC